MQRLLMFVIPILLAIPPAHGGTILVDFETFRDSDLITKQISGLTFTNTQIATAGILLNELDFPPHSGMNVVFDRGGPITISFDIPVTAFGAYFTYITRLTLVASGPAVPPSTPVFSHFSNNTATGGDPGSSSNEFLQTTFPGGITFVSISSDLAGGSFAMDDLTFTTGSAPVPEPASAVLTLIGLTGFGVCWHGLQAVSTPESM